MTKKFFTTLLSVLLAVSAIAQQQPQNAEAAAGGGEQKKQEQQAKVSIKILNWSFANSIAMPDFSTGRISSKKTAEKEVDKLWYKSGSNWHELKAAPRKMVTISYEGPQKVRFGVRKKSGGNSENPNADENFVSAGTLTLPVLSGDVFALMIQNSSTARFYPMNISPKELPKNKFAVMNMTRKAVAFNINGQTKVIGGGKSFIFSPKKNADEGLAVQIAKRVKDKWVPCYKNTISLEADAKTMLLVYDPANSSAPKFNIQVLNLK